MAGRGLEIVNLDSRLPERALGELVGVLVDSVEDGASVGFLAPLDPLAARAYWYNVSRDVEAGVVVLLAALVDGRIVGTVQLALAAQPNGAHRAEVRRLLVRRDARRRGIGRALMTSIESVALRLGRTLLLLNTRTGDPPEALYRSLGYQVVGTIPRFAQSPDGTMNTTTLMYRHLVVS